MHFSRRALALLLSALLSCSAVSAPVSKKDKRYFEERDGTTFTVFEHAETGAKMSFVQNSGICETTPGVNQYSGYLSVGTNMNMFFWFFEARSNPSTAPLVAWFNGGPGCSSLIGLFQENGPCQFVGNDTTPSLNPYSWNTYANMLYVDQPIGAGFSYGTDDVISTAAAAPYVWKLLQAFYAQFTEYENRDFGIFTESYGGHYGPEFAYYIQQQNAQIKAGNHSGQQINLVALGINNGWFDSLLQETAFLDYGVNNSYKQIITPTQYDEIMENYNTECLPALKQCAEFGINTDCQGADSTCYAYIEGPISQASNFNAYDVRAPYGDPNPPNTYVNYLQDPNVMKAIGAQSNYQACPQDTFVLFSSTGDNPRSFTPTLSSVVQSGINVILWAGDADWICNWIGVQRVADQVDYSGQPAFRTEELSPYTVNGVAKGMYKTVDNFTFLKVFNAGHEVPFYQPETALQVFVQTMQKKPIAST